MKSCREFGRILTVQSHNEVEDPSIGGKKGELAVEGIEPPAPNDAE